MILKKMEENMGFVSTDALIAVLIVSLFTGLIATLVYNINVVSSGVRRSVEVDKYIIGFCEYVDMSDFNDVTEQNLIDYVSNLNDNKVSATNGNINELDTPYKVSINISDYIPEGRNIGGLVKIVTLTLKYKLSNREKIVQIQHLKPNEI